MIHTHFSAELHCQYGQIGIGQWDAPFYPDAEERGWLCPKDGNVWRFDAAFVPVRFRFTFLGEEPGRAHYYISAVTPQEYADTRVEKSRTDWLGLYSLSGVSGAVNKIVEPLYGRSPWKIETLGERDNDLASVEKIDIYLRDEDGYRVSLATHIGWHKFKLLRAGDNDGEVLKFRLRNVEVPLD